MEPLKIVLTKRQRVEYDQYMGQAQMAQQRAVLFLTACVLGGLPEDGHDYNAWVPTYANGTVTLTPPVPDP